ncbi:MAG: hypothetical protein HY809_06225 [Nitrospirae bacterium]|nr:hypothetical protein [Nitrospirota bacterium]
MQISCAAGGRPPGVALTYTLCRVCSRSSRKECLNPGKKPLINM